MKSLRISPSVCRESGLLTARPRVRTGSQTLEGKTNIPEKSSDLPAKNIMGYIRDVEFLCGS